MVDLNLGKTWTRGQRNTNIRACKFQGAAEGEGVSHAAALPRLLREGTQLCQGGKKTNKNKKNLPSVLLTTNPNPGEEENPAAPSEGTARDGTERLPAG